MRAPRVVALVEGSGMRFCRAHSLRVLHPGVFVRVYLHLCANPRPAFVHVIGMYFDCYSNAGPVSPLLYYGEGRVFAVDVPAPGISV